MEQLAGSIGLQQSLRLGSSQDIWYYDSKTLRKQAIPSIVDTRFYQELNTLGQGSSTFIISVDQGISDVILGAKLPAQPANPGVGDVDYTGLVLPRGWLYALIDRISVRYASSSQYFWTGAQVLIENLREMPNPTTRDMLFELGGAPLLQLSDFAGDNLHAYAYLNLPHNSPNGSMGKPNPFPSELIGQPIVITVEMKYLPSIFSSVNEGGSVAAAPRALEKAYFQIRQVHAKDAGELMTMPGGRSVAYSFPTKCFYQNQVDIHVSGSTHYEELLTGFRNGEVRSIVFWITKDSDTNPAPNPPGPFVKNFTNFILPKNVQLLYNGTLYYRAEGPASQMWSLITTETPPQLEASVLSLNEGVITSDSKKANWVEIPFSQVFEQLSGAHMYVAGKLIQNAVVNLSLDLPDTAAYTIHAMYSYNCTMLIKDRGVDYSF